eukprot:1743096-Rhodomonas_salina.1
MHRTDRPTRPGSGRALTGLSLGSYCEHYIGQEPTDQISPTDATVRKSLRREQQTGGRGGE